MTQRRAPYDDALLARVLRPYRPDCRYVLEAEWSHPPDRRPPRADDPESWPTVTGRCAIPASCYIDDTGHFNAVELNITYNQLLYAGLAAAVRDALVPELHHWTIDDFWRHQLPDVLIVDYHAIFPRPLDPRAFTGRFELREVVPKPHKRMLLLRTFCDVRSGDDGHATAEVLIALVDV